MSNVSSYSGDQDEDSILSFHSEEDTGEPDDDISKESFIKYENTYRLESKNPFDEVEAMKIVKTEMEKHFNEESTYDQHEAENICKDISNNIKTKLVDSDFERYKIVCITQIVEKKNQGILSVVKFLRDLKKDKYVINNFGNNNLVAVVVVGALYYE